MNKLLVGKNTNFKSDYFKDIFLDKDSDYYLTKMNNLGIKVYCQEKAGKIYFTNKSNDSNIWPVPIFFLKDTIDWLLVFIKDAEDIHDHHTTKSILENNISNQEISNRLHDYLFNKIIISLKKLMIIIDLLIAILMT